LASPSSRNWCSSSPSVSQVWSRCSLQAVHIGGSAVRCSQQMQVHLACCRRLGGEQQAMQARVSGNGAVAACSAS
jgi:hypothetical protein